MTTLSNQHLWWRFQGLVRHLSSGLQERQEVVAVSLLGAIFGFNVFLYGPPGTAKSLIARRVASAFDGGLYFEALMHRFSTPEEVFGPVSISALKQDHYQRQGTNYLQNAHWAFLDEIWKSSPAILNSLLTILNEGIYKQGQVISKTPLKFAIAASNEVPNQKSGLDALYDRFVLRVPALPIQDLDNFVDFLDAEPLPYYPPASAQWLGLSKMEALPTGEIVSLPDLTGANLFKAYQQLSQQALSQGDVFAQGLACLHRRSENKTKLEFIPLTTTSSGLSVLDDFERLVGSRSYQLMLGDFTPSRPASTHAQAPLALDTSATATSQQAAQTANQQTTKGANNLANLESLNSLKQYSSQLEFAQPLTTHRPQIFIPQAGQQVVLEQVATYNSSSMMPVGFFTLNQAQNTLANQLEVGDFEPLAIRISEAEQALYRQEVEQVKLTKVCMYFFSLLRYQGMRNRELRLSDRRWKKLVTLVKAMAYVQGRTQTEIEDCLIIEHALWHGREQVQDKQGGDAFAQASALAAQTSNQLGHATNPAQALPAADESTYGQVTASSPLAYTKTLKSRATYQNLIKESLRTIFHAIGEDWGEEAAAWKSVALEHYSRFHFQHPVYDTLMLGSVEYVRYQFNEGVAKYALVPLASHLNTKSTAIKQLIVETAWGQLAQLDTNLELTWSEEFGQHYLGDGQGVMYFANELVRPQQLRPDVDVSATLNFIQRFRSYLTRLAERHDAYIHKQENLNQLLACHLLAPAQYSLIVSFYRKAAQDLRNQLESLLPLLDQLTQMYNYYLQNCPPDIRGVVAQ